MPVGNIFVGNARSDVEHDNAALSVDVVSISQTTEFLLTSSVPDVEVDLAKVLESHVSEAELDISRRDQRTVVKPRGWTSTPRVAMYFFSNSPDRWRLTKVV
jgi:hypothetical protein